MSGEFTNKVAVVTGGSRGIGREIAADLARAGAQTVIVSSSAANLAAASKTIAAAGPAPLAITADLRTLDGCQHVFDSVKDKFDRCDILVCSAGATRAGNFTELPDQAWIDGYALKFFGCVRMCRLFWPMLKAAQGCVVNIGGALHAPPALTSQSVHRSMRRWEIFQKRSPNLANAMALTSISSILARPRPNASTNCWSSARKHPANRLNS